MRSLAKVQESQIDKRVKLNKPIMSDKIVVFKKVKSVPNTVIGKLSK